MAGDGDKYDTTRGYGGAGDVGSGCNANPNPAPCELLLYSTYHSRPYENIISSNMARNSCSRILLLVTPVAKLYALVVGERLGQYARGAYFQGLSTGRVIFHELGRDTPKPDLT